MRLAMKDVAISADGVPIHYEAQGTGQPALVFIHGWSCNRSYWEKQVGHFARQYQVVAVDLAGHGESGLDRQAWTMPAFGADVVVVVEKLGLEQVVLIGHSMGGPVIIEAALRMPGRVVGLVGVDTYRNRERTWTQEKIDEILAPFRANFVEATQKFVRTMFIPESNYALVERIVNDMPTTPPEVGIGAMEGTLMNSLNLTTALKEVKAPIVAINSDCWPNDIESAQRHGIKVVFMSGVGHFVMMEDAQTFNSLLEEVVREFVGAKTIKRV
jgi:pimeloyl-ACP methyl ester carboxylesterase